ncbi:hypothetical protein B7P43_G14306 [Cryptotermes secundus]|uniref:Uncharacterized protein n=1 Tax=Cryptotermes secundus TaxID=105785 RepID=A0A2J7PTZ2_9NEOP|nr:uncharacterized protein LOC111871840 [Cryptotermes secundus]PNF19805.1 hypothetical protein B7P43_G14306 [Cryptotermes secundus]
MVLARDSRKETPIHGVEACWEPSSKEVTSVTNCISLMTIDVVQKMVDTHSIIPEKWQCQMRAGICGKTYYSAAYGHEMTLLLCTGRTVLRHSWWCAGALVDNTQTCVETCQQLLQLYSAGPVEFFECVVTVDES